MMNVRDELAAQISDTYKDLMGFRPRHINFATASIEELENILQGLYADMEAMLAQEDQEAQMEEAHIESLCEELEIDRDTYDRWMAQEENQ